MDLPKAGTTYTKSQFKPLYHQVLERELKRRHLQEKPSNAQLDSFIQLCDEKTDTRLNGDIRVTSSLIYTDIDTMARQVMPDARRWQVQEAMVYAAYSLLVDDRDLSRVLQVENVIDRFRHYCRTNGFLLSKAQASDIVLYIRECDALVSGKIALRSRGGEISYSTYRSAISKFIPTAHDAQLDALTRSLGQALSGTAPIEGNEPVIEKVERPLTIRQASMLGGIKPELLSFLMMLTGLTGESAGELYHSLRQYGYHGFLKNLSSSVVWTRGISIWFFRLRAILPYRVNHDEALNALERYLLNPHISMSQRVEVAVRLWDLYSQYSVKSQRLSSELRKMEISKQGFQSALLAQRVQFYWQIRRLWYLRFQAPAYTRIVHEGREAATAFWRGGVHTYRLMREVWIASATSMQDVSVRMPGITKILVVGGLVGAIGYYSYKCIDDNGAVEEEFDEGVLPTPLLESEP